MKKNYRNAGLFVVLFSFIFLIIAIFTMGFSIEKPITISKNVIDSMYLENNLSYNNYNNYSNNSDNIDNSITKESLKLIKNLTIDINNLGDSTFFKYLTNLEVLTIKNYQSLNTNDIDNLKYLNSLKILNISIDGNYVLKNPNYTIDLSMFSNLETLYITCDLPNEIDSYISYNLIKNNKIKNVIFSNDLTIDELSIWNNKINIIIDNLHLENSNEKEKLNIIANYVMNNLQYDKDIYNYLLNTSNVDSSQKISQYNINLLSSILNNDNNIKDVICCNYAAFANILLYKAQIESYYMLGNVDNTRHAWNLVNIDNNYYFMDLTYVDNDYDYNLLISQDMKEYQLYSNYSLPIVNEKLEELVYYNIDTDKIVIKWNGQILTII